MVNSIYVGWTQLAKVENEEGESVCEGGGDGSSGDDLVELCLGCG